MLLRHLVYMVTLFHVGMPGATTFPPVDWQNVIWTEQELSMPIATHHLSRTADKSSHLIRLMGKETPHYHDNHDLSIKVLAGQSVVHIEDKDVLLAVGDELVVPRGTLHWAENNKSEANIVLVVFQPGFDGKDKRQANEQ